MKSRRISPALALVGVLLALGLAGLVVLFLSDDDEAGPQHSPPSAIASRSADPQAPSFRAAPPEPRAAVPVEVPEVSLAPEANAGGAGDNSVPLRQLAGRVVRLSDSSPLPGVLVDPQRGYHSVLSYEAGSPFTNEEGLFSLARVPADATSLRFRMKQGWPERSQNFPLTPGHEALLGLHVVFDSGFIVQGEVRDSTGHPVAGALVDDEQSTAVAADAFGRFTLHDLAPEAGVPSVRIWARSPGHVRTGVDVLVPADVTRVQRVEIVLPASGVIAGRITDRHGTVLPGLQVKVAWIMTSEHAEEAPDSLQGVSDVLGAYRVDHVPAGRYIVLAGEEVDFSVDPSGAAPNVSPARMSDVVVVAGSTTELDFVLFGPSSISGRVRDEFGTPVSNAELTLHQVQRWPAPDVRGHTVTQGEGVRISSRSGEEGGGETELLEIESYATTDDRGDYEFTDLRAGEKRLSVAPDDQGLVPQTRTLLLPPDEHLVAVDFTLERGLTLRGRVTDQAGLPLAGVTVQVKPAEAASYESSQRLVTGDDGRFELQGLPSTQLQLLLIRSGYSTYWQEVQPGGPEQTFVLRQAHVITGQVTHAVHGQPITRFDITVSHSNTTMSNVGAEYAEGRFEFPVNDDEPCTLIVRAAGFADVLLEQVLPSQTAIVPLRIQLTPLP